MSKWTWDEQSLRRSYSSMGFVITLFYFNNNTRKVSDLILFCENLVDFNEARLHEANLNLYTHTWIFSTRQLRLLMARSIWVSKCLVLSSDFIVRKMMGPESYPCTQDSQDILDSTNSDPHFMNTIITADEYNENPTREVNTSLKCCLPSTDANKRREKIHAWVWRVKVTSSKSASLKSTRFSGKK